MIWIIDTSVAVRRNRVQIVSEGSKRAITRIAPTHLLLQRITIFDGGYRGQGYVIL